MKSDEAPTPASTEADPGEGEELASEELVEISAPRRPVPTPPPPPTAAPSATVTTTLSEKSRKRRRPKQWFEEVFDEDYLRTLPSMTPQQTEHEADLILDALGIQTRASLLDVGCGYGRHAMALTVRGHQVTGLDLSLPLLLRAADIACQSGLQINFLHGDMRTMQFDAEFDAAYCFFTTFGYFDDETNRKVVGLIAKALKPGGRLLLDMLNRDYLVRDLPARVWWQGQGCMVLEEVNFNYFNSRLQVQRSIAFDDGRQVEQEIRMRAYALHEVGRLLQHAGFRILELSSSAELRGRFFGGESRQILVVAEKR